MAKTTLRAYNRDIETMLDRGQLDEAIAHCHHILKSFPKNLSTYRLLGKAFLEMKKYSDAVDIFSRVLACVPNDFVANVGMSLIRDEENKLDDAVMHMERAFETQPSNAAVQSELQRLYGRRDGVSPPRIRMTRGALAHMYVKGELYPQAISEIRTVLKEDPGRTDMEVLLARAHYRSGQKNEAVEVASSLLRRYPLCLDANAVLVDILGADKLDSVQENRQRVIELDPYAAHVTGSILDSSSAPDSAVTLERLDWSGQSVSMPSDWRETRGISLQAASPEEPEWLKKSLEQTETTPQPAGEAEFRMDAPAQPEGEIPEFLREAGWGKSTGAFDESKASLTSEEDTLPPTAAAPLAAGEMPDWVKALAPTEHEKPVSDEPMPDWMNRIDPSILPPASEQPAAGDQPNWLKGLDQPEETSQPVPAFGDEPDWLKGLGEHEDSQAPATATDDLDFLKQLKEQPQESQPQSTPAISPMDAAGLGAQAEDDAFAWLESLAVKQGSTEGLLVKPEDRLEEEPDWVKQAKSLSGGMEVPTTPIVSEPVGSIPAAPVGDIEDLGKSGQEQDDSFAWLESLAVKQGSTEGLLVKPEDRMESEPDWVKQAKEIGEPIPPTHQEEMKQPDSPVDTAMWLKSLDGEGPVHEPVKESSSDATAMWLKNLDSESAEPEPSKPSASDETAVWLKSLDEEEKPVAPQSALREDLPDWMQNLEAVDAATAVESTVPEEEAQTSSDWISEITPEEPKRYDTGSLPSWLEDVDAGRPVSAFSASRDDLPAWLRDETGEVVAEPTKIEPTRADDWQPMDVQEPESLEPPAEMPKAEPKPKKTAPPVKKPEPRPAAPMAVHQEPLTRQGAAVSTQTVDMVLGQARNELNRSNIPGALETYAKLIKKGRYLDEVIFDLREALYRYPVEVSIWQTLGDAYMRGNRLQDALDAYTKAEELLR
ncbi:MAG: tetratricopeptide repeat protein [Chloroflexota bacterium]